MLCDMRDENKVFRCRALFGAPRVLGWVVGSKRVPARGGTGIQQMLTELEAEGRKHVITVRRIGAAPAAVVTDNAKCRGGAKVPGTSPGNDIPRSTGIVQMLHALGFVILVLNAIRVEVTPDFQKNLETEDRADNVSLSVIFNISIKTYIAEAEDAHEAILISWTGGTAKAYRCPRVLFNLKEAISIGGRHLALECFILASLLG